MIILTEKGVHGVVGQGGGERADSSEEGMLFVDPSRA